MIKKTNGVYLRPYDKSETSLLSHSLSRLDPTLSERASLKKLRILILQPIHKKFHSQESMSLDPMVLEL